MPQVHDTNLLETPTKPPFLRVALLVNCREPTHLMRNLLALLLFSPNLCLAQLPDYVPTNGLVAWYPLDGDGVDLGPYGDSLTPHGVTWSPDRFGQDQGACSFDGMDDYLLNDALNGLMESSSYSISFWIRKLAPSCEPLIVVGQWNSVASSGQSLHVGYRPCGQTGCTYGGCFFHDTYSNTCQTGSLTVDSAWHHLIVTSDVATGRRTIHEDGVLLKEDFLESWQGNFSQGLLVGAHHYTGGFTEAWMDGQLDELGIWNRALTEAEIEALYESVEVELPGHVPSEGLVAWYPLDGNASDLSGLGHHGIVTGPMPSMDRFGNPNGAYYFNDASSISANLQGVGNGNVPVTISSWVQIEQTSTDVSYVAGVGDAPYVSEGTVFGMGEYGGSGLFATMAGSQFDAISGTAISLNQWVMLTAVHEGDGSVKLYVDSTETFSFQGSTPNIQFDVALIGTAPWGGSFWSGNIDEVGIWSRALTEEEVHALFLGAPIEYGCTDFQACNYDQEASADNGLCEYGCLYCGEGTVWDSTLQECVGVIPPADSILVPIPSCGEGTVWDPVNEECIIAIPADLNYDGCVSVTDLLVLLAVHGTCPPYPEWPDEPTDTTWTCGDLLTYWDYNYATVFIGDQCWFAENLDTEHFSNGEDIPQLPSNWVNLTTPAFGYYDYDSSGTALYNHYAIQDPRGLCPNGWHTPTQFELESLLNETWPNVTFSGYINADPFNQLFIGLGEVEFLWSSTEPTSNRAIALSISSLGTQGIADHLMTFGFSVRCVQDE